MGFTAARGVTRWGSSCIRNSASFQASKAARAGGDDFRTHGSSGNVVQSSDSGLSSSHYSNSIYKFHTLLRDSEYLVARENLSADCLALFICSCRIKCPFSVTFQLHPTEMASMNNA